MADLPDHPRRRESDNGGVFSRSYWTSRGVVPRWQLLLVYLLIAAVGIVGFVSVGNQADKATKTAEETRKLALVSATLSRDTARLAREIQSSRTTLCEDQNKRHDRTIERLNKIIDQAKRRQPDRAAEIERARAQNILLIEALAPEQDCAAVVSPTPTPTPTPTP